MEINERFWKMVKKMKAYFGVVFLQISFAVMYTIVAISLKHGLSHFAFSVYRHAVATFLLAPFALILERKTRPPMTFPIFLRILLLGFLEPILDQNLYYLGMKYTSATFASAAANILPAITFIMAVIFRVENINLKKKHSSAKIFGTVITVTGAMVMSLYKGPAFSFLPSLGGRSIETATKESVDQHWVIGTIFVLISCCGWSTFFILQSATLKMYPAELSLAALICLAGMVGGAAVSLASERDMMIWVFGWDSRLLAVLYSGIVCSGIGYYVQGVVIKERGPVFVTSFRPLCTVITAALSSIFLAEKVHLGRDFETSEKPSNHVKELPITNSTSRSTAADDSNASQDAGKMAEAPAKPPIL